MLSLQGVENGFDCQIGQNPWGAACEVQGYFRIKKGECGIDSNA